MAIKVYNTSGEEVPIDQTTSIQDAAFTDKGIAIAHSITVGSKAEMMALIPPVGSQCYRTDTKELYVYVGP